MEKNTERHVLFNIGNPCHQSEIIVLIKKKEGKLPLAYVTAKRYLYYDED